jgi:hypothetical protein
MTNRRRLVKLATSAIVLLILFAYAQAAIWHVVVNLSTN